MQLYTLSTCGVEARKHEEQADDMQLPLENSHSKHMGLQMSAPQLALPILD